MLSLKEQIFLAFTLLLFVSTADLACTKGGNSGLGDGGTPNIIDDNPCATLANELPGTPLSRPPVEEMDAVEAWTGYAFHHTHVHNEGVGKWYLYPTKSIEVRAPTNGRICTAITSNPGSTSSVTSVDGNAITPDSSFDLYIGNDQRISYGHIWALNSLIAAFNAADDDGIEVKAGDLIGYTSPDTTALDFQIVDENLTNGLPEIASHVKTYSCPMNHYEQGSSLKTQLMERWNELTYEPAKEAKTEAVAAEERASTGNAELASDSCSTINVNTMNHGTIWGNWYNLGGESGDPSIGTWYHYARGTVTILPNSMLNNETYTVGFAGEDGLWSEMQSNAGHGSPWVVTSYLASLWLPDGTSGSDESGCFALSTSTIDAEDVLWIYFQLTPVDGGNDLLTLTQTWADSKADCLAWGTLGGVQEKFSRYPAASSE